MKHREKFISVGAPYMSKFFLVWQMCKKTQLVFILSLVVEGGVKGVSRIRRSLSEACVGVMS